MIDSLFTNFAMSIGMSNRVNEEGKKYMKIEKPAIIRNQRCLNVDNASYLTYVEKASKTDAQFVES